jgi:hypothetical protein
MRQLPPASTQASDLHLEQMLAPCWVCLQPLGRQPCAMDPEGFAHLACTDEYIDLDAASQ